MNRLRDIVSIAATLLRDLGPDGHLVIAERAEQHRRDGDHQAADLWAQVSRAMRELSRPEPVRVTARAVKRR